MSYMFCSGLIFIDLNNHGYELVKMSSEGALQYKKQNPVICDILAGLAF